MAHGGKSKFRVGEKVRVAAGTNDPDFALDIGGWIGEVIEIDSSGDGPCVYCVRWTDDTITNMGQELVQRCERDGLDHRMTFLEEAELEPAGA